MFDTTSQAPSKGQRATSAQTQDPTVSQQRLQLQLQHDADAYNAVLKTRRVLH